MTAALDADHGTMTTGAPSGGPARPAPTDPPDTRAFDGVICFGGEDWWYHNRGHFDMQMMRELSRVVPVLYINSIGMRVPRLGEGAMFFKRVARKLRSLRRGLVRVRDDFAVFSPLAAPGRAGGVVTGALLPAQVRRAARRLGIRRPLVWVACPPGAPYTDRLNAVGVVYQRTDRYEAFAGVDPVRIRGYDRSLKDRAEFTVYCSRSLMNEERNESTPALFIDHGVDFDMFSAAGRDKDEPDDVRALPRPRVGFIGGIDAHTFDPPLFVEVARLLSDVTFVMIGACSLPEGWCPLPNVHLLGQRPYERVASYMASCDVLIMPWNDSPWIRACNPVKLKEYLAVGRPVVSTGFDELAHYAGFVREARGPQAFAQAIRAALSQPGDPEARRRRVERETWLAKGEQVLSRLAESGLVPRRGGL
ncbi:MAG TPA: hypothetical protein DEB06_09230 [Phycisphaerales bacterium]|nr:hypothetical protein [Phycisphaerales bacterium]